jgi:hypothetical protein
MARARAVLVLAVLASVGLGVFVFLRERNEVSASSDDASVGDASIDRHATGAKGSAAARNKNKPRRAGKTRVTGRDGAGPAARHAPNEANTAAPPADDESAKAPPRPHRHYAVSGPSYESALAANTQHITMGANAGPDLTDAQLSGPMSDGSFIGDCDAPDEMEVTVKVAIKMGRPVGVTVQTHPSSSDVAGCIDHHVRALTWPASPKMDSFITTY